jgi:hypothetical protein
VLLHRVWQYCTPVTVCRSSWHRLLFVACSLTNAKPKRGISLCSLALMKEATKNVTRGTTDCICSSLNLCAFEKDHERKQQKQR